jgi:hypothetical protein
MNVRAPAPHRGTILAVLLQLCLLHAPATQAIEINPFPADFNGQPGTVFASWEFLFDPTPDGLLDIFPDTFNVVPTAGGAPFFPALPTLLPELTPLTPEFSIATFLMPNFISDHPLALYQFQTSMLFGGAIPIALTGVGIFDEFGIDIGTPSSDPIILSILGGTGLYYAQEWVVAPSPDLAFINMLVPNVGVPFTINVIIESQVTPEPGALVLLASGLVVMCWQRRRRGAPRTSTT